MTYIFLIFGRLFGRFLYLGRYIGGFMQISMELKNGGHIVVNRIDEAGKLMSRTVIEGGYSLCLDLADTLQLSETVQRSDYSKWEG